MGKRLFDPEIEAQALAFLDLGKKDGCPEKRAQRLSALLSYLGKDSELAHTIRDELSRLEAMRVEHDFQACARTALLRKEDDLSLLPTFQPLVLDKQGRNRFWGNSLFMWLVSQGPYAFCPFVDHFTMGEREHVAMLLGMERDVFARQPFVRRGTAEAALRAEIVPLVNHEIPAHPAPEKAIGPHGGLVLRSNQLVRFLVEQSRLTREQILAVPASPEDREQLLDLIDQAWVGM